MITSRKELAGVLSNGGVVEIDEVSARLKRIVALWASYGDVKIQDNFIIGCF